MKREIKPIIECWLLASICMLIIVAWLSGCSGAQLSNYMDFAKSWKSAADHGDTMAGARALVDLAKKEEERTGRKRYTGNNIIDGYESYSEGHKVSSESRRTLTVKAAPSSGGVIEERDFDPQPSLPVGYQQTYYVSIQNASELWKNGAYFIDARSENDFASSHIKYSCNIPEEKMIIHHDSVYEIISTIPLDSTLIVYGGGGDGLSKAKYIRYRLKTMGYQKAKVLNEPYKEWVAGGYPVVQGD